MFLAKSFNFEQDLEKNPSNIGLAIHLYICSVIMVIKLMGITWALHVAGRKKKTLISYELILSMRF